MEIKINKEIRNYTESVFFGLTLRQLVFSAIACAVAAGVFIFLKDSLGTETVSWICILAAAPFALFGFVKYHGMTAEKLIWAWIKSEVLTPKKLAYKPTNLYYEMMKPYLERRRKEVMNSDAQIVQTIQAKRIDAVQDPKIRAGHYSGTEGIR